MQSLLRWGIENSTPQNTNTNTTATNNTANAPPSRRPDLNPEIIDLLLGKSDAVLMKEAMAIAVDEGNTEEDRVSALDNLEMLIEQIDNANNLSNLKMWEPLHALLTSSPDSVTVQALWVIGTALQNNPSAQDAYLKLNPLPTLTSFLSPPPPPQSTTPDSNSNSPSPNFTPPKSPKSKSNSKPPPPSKPLRSKAIYALSGLLKHNAPALLQLDVNDAHGCDGWDRLCLALQDPDITIRRKTLFLLNALLIPSPDPSPSPSPSLGNLHTPSQNSQTQNLHTPAPAPVHPIHPNSHSIHLSDPARVSTSAPTYQALHTHGIIDTLIVGLTRSLPYGGDGDTGDTKEEVDGEFEEMGVG
ncbi:nucleotide exchange factor Fes1-domain-containing protein [Lentinula edodes]|uniref:nucleotide exchange factor Fes1-domain-containing protein n=1 Tax=Lentinula edodes TaxID=5353 RepID=UPI001E8E5BD4|nr:nucleotide exchange factor Fes1-domain-containing protein [Lentinula edodes]KAH7880326.1 nucleotide exchange factor Fes1-domain-containing protein [Lentinula edodes]